MKRKFKLILIGTLVIDTLIINVLTKTSTQKKVYLRNSIFTTIISDEQAPSESAVNKIISAGFKKDDISLDARAIFSQKKLSGLLLLAKPEKNPNNCRSISDHSQTVLTPTDCIARKLALDLSPKMMGGKCGLDGSLRYKINKVSNGIGCCSDYNDAFIIRGKAVGLEVREVNNLVHTTAEYYDQEKGRWKWIDTTLRTQISDPNGQLLSAYTIRRKNLWHQLTLVSLPPYPINREQAFNFGGYRKQRYGIVEWAGGNNLIEQEKFELPLVNLYIPREVVQFISLAIGKRPKTFTLIAQEAKLNFSITQISLRILIISILIMNTLTLWIAIAYTIRYLRSLMLMRSAAKEAGSR